MDGAFALYEAWVHLQMGHIDTALVYSFGKTSLCDIEAVYNAQDPATAVMFLRGDLPTAGRAHA